MAAIALAGVLAAWRLWSIHQQTSDWVLWPKAIPSKVQFAGREYNCGPTPQPAQRDVIGMTMQGKTAGGAEILAEPSSGEARVFIIVKTADRTVGCGLLGGP
ncbi:hypothetical protein ACFFGR_11790 [Arthrobacter liuii]|uniref:Uncharacterized protein n=1 Tax=Arthrobacter liuii TaxID=1476996 RepID=A0ABQ2AC16_9MICC|nr:hypothetical protein [Arthrobacter liuii]GGH89672.1 hypothetical protein GCM10007170_01640 [Arthrobacter liuii]